MEPGQDPAVSLTAILRTLSARAPGLRGVAIADRNGLPISSEFRQKMPVPTVCAMGTLVAQASNSVFEGLGYERFEFGTLEGKSVKVLVCQIGSGAASLIVILEPETNLGLAKLEIERAAEEIAFVLGL